MCTLGRLCLYGAEKCTEHVPVYQRKETVRLLGNNTGTNLFCDDDDDDDNLLHSFMD